MNMDRFLPLLYFSFLTVLFLQLTSAQAYGENNSYVISSTGIGPVQLGKRISELPNHVPGLYDSLNQTQEVVYDEGAYEESFTVYLAKLGGDVLFKINPTDDGLVSSITVVSSRLKTKSGLSLASTPSELFKKGVIVESNNSGWEGLICEGVLFVGFPETMQGMNKSQQAYFGEDVKFTEQDFQKDGHAKEILISSYYSQFLLADTNKPVVSVNTPKTFGEWLSAIGLLLLFILGFALFCSPIVHMVYVKWFAKPLPFPCVSESAPEENDKYVTEALNSLHSEAFQDYSILDPDSNTYITQTGPLKTRAYKRTVKSIKEFNKQYMPVSKGVAKRLEKDIRIVNALRKRSFTGSVGYLVFCFLIALISHWLMEDWNFMHYFLISTPLYFLAYQAPHYVLIRRELKNKKNDGSNSAMAGLFNMAISAFTDAPVTTTIWRREDTKEEVYRETDWIPTILGFMVMFVLFMIGFFAMMPVSLIAYIRNYWLR